MRFSHRTPPAGPICPRLNETQWFWGRLLLPTSLPVATRKELWERRQERNARKAAELEKERNQTLVDYLKRRDDKVKQFEENEAKKLQDWLNDRKG